MNTPVQTAVEFSSAGVAKAKMPFAKFAVAAFMGGTFIALGGLLTLIVAGGMPGVNMANPGLVRFVAGALFPIGLMLVTATGADLFTSDCAGMVLPMFKRQTNFKQLLKILALSYLFNFAGTQFVAYFMAYKAGLLSEPYVLYLHNLAHTKVNLDFFTIFIKGIGANWLVCLGALMGYAGKNFAGKMLGIWIPVMVFVTLGYEHSIANMFFIPAAIYSDAGITWGQFISSNLIPSTLGNIVGGAGLVGCIYGYFYFK